MLLRVLILPLKAPGYLTKTPIGVPPFELLLREVPETPKIAQTIYLPEVEGRSLLLKTSCHLNMGLRGTELDLTQSLCPKDELPQY